MGEIMNEEPLDVAFHAVLAKQGGLVHPSETPMPSGGGTLIVRGMTMRQWYAGQALPALMPAALDYEDRAIAAFRQADAMIRLADPHPSADVADTPEQEACPICGGDCASANPPMAYCPMRDAPAAADTGELVERLTAENKRLRRADDEYESVCESLQAAEQREAAAEHWQEHYRNSAEILRMDLSSAQEQIRALADVLTKILRCEYDGHGLTDCTDNTGVRYPSAYLAEQIDKAESLLAALTLTAKQETTDAQ